jgi:hypothetical protein
MHQAEKIPWRKTFGNNRPKRPIRPDRTRGEKVRIRESSENNRPNRPNRPPNGVHEFSSTIIRQLTGRRRLRRRVCDDNQTSVANRASIRFPGVFAMVVPEDQSRVMALEVPPRCWRARAEKKAASVLAEPRPSRGVPCDL